MNQESIPSARSETGVLQGGGEMGERMRAFDWSATSLGPAEGWPQSLKTAVRIMLTSRQPMFVWWGAELLNLYNDPYKSIVGGRHPHALGQPASVVWAEIWKQIAPRVESAIVKNEGTYDEALRLIMERNGYPEETYYTFSYSPIPSDDGVVGGIICANTDDTARIIGERQLALLRELAASSASARTYEDACRSSARSLETNGFDFPFGMIYLIDEEVGHATLAGTSGIDSSHPAAPAIIDLSESAIWPLTEVLATRSLSLVFPDDRFGPLPTGAWDRPPSMAAVVPIPASGDDGQATVLVVGLNPFRLFDDNYHGFVDLVASQIAAGINNAGAYEQERRRAEALAELDRAKTAFFSNVSHEFRTPLTLMLGPVDDILAKPESEVFPGNRELLEIVQRNGGRLLKLVNTLLDFSRIEAGRVQAVYEPVDLSAYTAELASVFRAAVERAGMTLRIEAPTLSEQAFVDRDMWEKIVLNLVSNAFKYTLEGEIAVTMSEENGHAVLRVADTGTGIPAEELPKLFNRFHRVEGARGRTQEGTGIGLALVHELAKLHGGSVGVESRMGEGSLFTVRIPLGSTHLPHDRIGGARKGASTALGASAFVEEALRWLPDAEPLRPASALANDSGTATARHGSDEAQRTTVLLADDNADMREYVERLLATDYEVIATRDGEEALAAAIERRPDLVLTDVMMPKLDGFGLLDALRGDERTASIPVIMLSARAGEEARVEGLLAGADDYLIKPFSARELLARVGGTIALSRLRRDSMRREEELRAERIDVLETIADAFVAFDREFRFTYVNKEAERIYGTKREELLGRVCWEIFPQTLGTIAETEYRRTMTERVPTRFEIFYTPWSRWFEVNANPSLDGGEAVYFRDITERKRVEAIMEGQRRALMLAMHGAPLDTILEVLTQTVETQSTDDVIASILLLDEDGVHLRHGAAPHLPDAYNHAIDGVEIGPSVGSCGTAAYRKEAVVVTDIASDPLWSDFRELALSHGLHACWSTPITSSQGVVLGTFAIYYHQPSSPSESDRQVVELVAHTAAIVIERQLEMRERKRAEEELREAQRRLAAALRGGAVGTFRWNIGTNELDWDENLDRLFGLPAGETARNLDQFVRMVHPDDRAGVIERCERSAADGSDFDMIFRVVWPDGQMRWLADRGTCFFDTEGNVDFMTGACVDVTDHKRAEDALKEADRRKDEFLATLAHELRNPLAPLRSGLELLRVIGSDEDDTADVRRMMERQLGQMVRLIDDLLDVSRISRNKLELRTEPLELSRVLQSAMETTRPLIEQSGHTLNVQMPSEPIIVDGDMTRLSQVFSNLLNNAAKYTERGGRIDVSIEANEGMVTVTILDNGIGIPKEMLPRIFEMFTQVDHSIEKSHGGLGIGLTLVHRLVEMHGGTITAHSDGPGTGSRFTVRLPAISRTTTPNGRQHTTTERSALDGRRILVVDDNKDSALALAMLLSRRGNEIRSAHDGIEALGIAEEFQPEVILLDIGMPRLNGYDVARQIRGKRWGQNVVLIAITGWGQEQDRQRSREAGFDHHLLKPVEPSALERLLGNAR